MEGLYIVKGRILEKFELIIKHGRSETWCVVLERGQIMNATYNITGKLVTILALVNTILEFGDPEH